MLVYTIEHNLSLGAFVEKRLHITGKIDSSQWERLGMLLFDSLCSSDHLIVNIENDEEFDYQFSVLICSALKSAHLLGKRLTVEGKAAGLFPCMHAGPEQERNKGCALSPANPCYLDDGRAGGTSASPRRRKGRAGRGRVGPER